MKRNLILSAVLFAVAAINTAMYATDLNRTVSEDVLNGIQGKVEDAMNDCFVKRDIAPLDSLSKSLDKLTTQNNIVLYWKSYIDYYRSVFYLKMGDKSNSKKAVKKAYVALEKMSGKSSEDYALLALVQSFYIQFASGMSAGALSSKITGNAEKALELDSTNLRGWYVLGSNDFYTPESFGGGKKVDYYLKKAISAVPKNIPNPYLPTWGREYAFELLIRYYIRKGKKEEAKEYLQMAEKEYPDSYFISEYKKKAVTE